MGNEPKVLIYSQMFCGYCSAARALLDEKGVGYEDIDITMKPQLRLVRSRSSSRSCDITMKPQLRLELRERTGRRTVPQIYIGDRHIGGYDDLAALDASGELDELLGTS